MQPDISIRMTAHDHLRAHRQALRAAQNLLGSAVDARERVIYRVWVINAERHIDYWTRKIMEEQR